MNVKVHAYERYCERVMLISKEEIKAYIAGNKDDLTKSIMELFERSKFLWYGKIAEQDVSNYYIVDNICMVLNKANDAIITLYLIDFGFSGDINNSIIDGIMKEIATKEESKHETNQIIANDMVGIVNKELYLKDQVTLVERQLATLKSMVDDLMKAKQTVYHGLTVLDCEIEKLAKQLIYNINFRLETVRK